jgi:hypothetical protein
MGRHGKDDWLRDMNARQRNIVFPDIVQNDARFWRNASGKPLTVPQWIGVLLISATLVACLTGLWPRGEAPWWHKLIDGYAVFGVLTVAFVAFILIGNRRARRKASKRW